MVRALFRRAGMVLVVAAMACAPAHARAPERVHPTVSEPIAIGRQLQELVDPSGRMTIDEVLTRQADFAPVTKDTPTYGIGRGAAWTRVDLDLSADALRNQRRIQFDALHPDAAELFVVDENGVVLRRFIGGLDHPESTTDRRFSMSLAGLPAQFTVYARLTTHHVSTLGLTLTSATQEVAEEMEVERALGPAFGAMGLAALYCLLLWAYLPKATRGYGFAFVLSMFIAAHPYVNVDHLYWPQALLQPNVIRFIYFFGVGMIPTFGVLFSSHFLLTPQHHPRRHRVACTSASIIAIAYLFVVTVEPYWFMPINTLSVVVAASLIAWLLITALKARVETARSHAFVMIPVTACLVATNFTAYGLVLRHHPILVSLTVLGLTSLACGVTFLLADGFRRGLERKVQERTAALSSANAALKEVHDAKNRMLGVVAHDLRSPLSAIKAAAQLLLDFPLPQNKRDTLTRTIRDGAQMTLAMTEDLLDVAAIEQGTIVLDPEACDLITLIEERLDLFRLTAQPKNITVEFRGLHNGHALPPVWADKRRIGQALDNLVSNAVKFSPAQGVVTIALAAEDGQARLSVIDCGAGIPPEEIDGIFTPFKRASTRPTAGERSTGLGLAIVKRLIEAQGGAVTVHSTPGAGSRFDLLLPFTDHAVQKNAAE
jgi:signal transduction histidine kinase